MFVTGLLLAATVAAPPAPPVPPAPSAPQAPFTTVAPPAPPTPPGADGWGIGRRTVITRDVDGHRVTVVAQVSGEGARPAVLAYRDAQGRDVQVYSDRPVAREEADRLLAEARVEGERARAEGARARAEGARAREQGRLARIEGERAGREAAESARRAVDEARLSSRDFADLGADLGPVRELRVYRDGPPPTVDGRRFGPAFAGERPEVRALRDEVQALRDELKGLRAELERSRTRR